MNEVTIKLIFVLGIIGGSIFFTFGLSMIQNHIKLKIKEEDTVLYKKVRIIDGEHIGKEGVITRVFSKGILFQSAAIYHVQFSNSHSGQYTKNQFEIIKEG